MPRISKKLFTFLLVVVCAGLVLGVKCLRQKSRDEALAKLATARTKGNPAAPLRIIEYIDFQCPACAVGNINLSRYFKEYPDKIFLDVKYFPLTMHKHAFKAAYYAECAARQEKFWPFQDLLVQRQKQWSGLTDPEPAFKKMAREIGMDPKQLEACLQDATVTAEILKCKTGGEALGVKATPTYFVNDEMTVGLNSLKGKLDSFFDENEKEEQKNK